MDDLKRIHIEGHDVTITIGGVEVTGWAEPFWVGEDRGVESDAFSVAVPHTIELTPEDDAAAREFFKLTPEEEAEQAKFRKHIDSVLSGELRPVTDYVKISTNVQAVNGHLEAQKRRRKCICCDQPSIEPSGSNTTGKLCRQHAQERRNRQTQGRAYPKCRCGGTAAKGQLTCRSCADLDEARQATAQSRELFGKALKRLREITSGLEYCCSPSAYCAELEEIADTLEAFR